MSVWYSIFLCFLAVVTVVGNGLVIFLITTKQRLRTTANWFILSLAVADFGWGILFFPYYTFCGVKDLCFEEEGNFLRAFMTFFFGASTCSLCAVTADRYIAIVKPLKYTNLMSTKRVFIVIAVAWISSFLFTTTSCIVLFTTEKKSTPVLFFEGLVLFLILLTCLILIIATGHIVYITWKHSRQLAIVVAQLNFNQPQAAPVITVRRSTRESSSAKIITIVVMVYVLCIINNVVVIFCLEFDLCKPWLPLHYAMGPLLTANSALNPVAYSFLKKDIKIELKRLFRRTVGVSD